VASCTKHGLYFILNDQAIQNRKKLHTENMENMPSCPSNGPATFEVGGVGVVPWGLG
jgi:hypothetical protein